MKKPLDNSPDIRAMTTRSPAGNRPKRTRVTSGADYLRNIDGRSATALRMKEIATALVTDAGGMARVSEARAALIRRFATLAVQAEAMEARLVNGADLDVSEYSLLVSTMVRVATRLGLHRVSRETTPDLATYVATLNARKTNDIEHAEDEAA